MKSKDFFELIKLKGINYTEEQLKIIKSRANKNLVIAVPGAGKTTTILGKIAYSILVENEKAENILPITFTKASAEDMITRFNKLFKEEIKECPKFQTIHSFSNSLLSQWMKTFNKKLKLIDTKTSINIINNSYKELFNEYIEEEDIEKYQTLFSFIKNRDLKGYTIKEFENSIPNELKVNDLYGMFKLYEKKKDSSNLYDFDDMLLRTNEILKEHPKTRTYLNEKYKWIYIDESQDTSILQHCIIKQIINEKTKMCIVGDEDQSIYAFRGAYPEIMMEVDNFYNIKFKEFYMNKNFRSNENIIKIANNIIKDNKKRFNKENVAVKKEKGNVNILQMNNTEEISKFLKKETIKNKDKSIGILYRNNLSLIYLTKNFLDLEVDFDVMTYSNRLLNHWIVKDILNILKLYYNPMDIDALSSIYYKMQTYTSKKTIEELKKNVLMGKYGGNYDLLEKLKQIEKKTSVANSISERILVFKNARKKDIFKEKSIYSFLLNIKYIDYIYNIQDKKKCKNNNLINIINNFIELTNGLEYNEFLNEINKINRILQSKARCKTKNKNVMFTTLHSAKGLEFDEVYLIDYPEIPLSENANEEERKIVEEEERRLFYVGCTRAKNNLTILSDNIKQNIFIPKMLIMDKKEQIIKIN